MSGDLGHGIVDGELVVRAGDEGGLLAAQSTHPLTDRDGRPLAGHAGPDRMLPVERLAAATEPAAENAPPVTLLAAAGRPTVITRAPTTSRAHTGGFTRPAWRRRIGPSPAAARSSGCWPPAGRPLVESCSRTSRSLGVQPRVEQITCRSSNRIVTGRPDHRWDIFPALITRPASASIACSCDAFQTSRCAAAIRRFHFIVIDLRTGQRPGGRRRPRHVRCGCCRHARKSSWCSATGDPKPLEWQRHSYRSGRDRRQRNAATGVVTTGRGTRAAAEPPPRTGRTIKHRWSRTCCWNRRCGVPTGTPAPTGRSTDRRTPTAARAPTTPTAVSYTHLTLPT